MSMTSKAQLYNIHTSQNICVTHAEELGVTQASFDFAKNVLWPLVFKIIFQYVDCLQHNLLKRYLYCFSLHSVRQSKLNDCPTRLLLPIKIFCLCPQSVLTLYPVSILFSWQDIIDKYHLTDYKRNEDRNRFTLRFDSLLSRRISR